MGIIFVPAPVKNTGIMEILRDRNKRESAIAVAIISIIVLILMLILGLKVPDPPLETGIPMMISFGMDNQGDGDVQPEEISEPEVVPEEVMESTPIPVVTEENALTQDVEETIAASEETSNTEETKVVEEVPEQQVDQNALYPGKRTSTDGSQGNTGDPGDQGSPDGSDNNNPAGLYGSGKSFMLSGRSMTHKPSLHNTTQETGKVVVNIWVDRYGKVKRATPGAKGSTTTNAQLYKIAKAAALKAKFSANSKAPEEQKGTIVFEFLSGQ